MRALVVADVHSNLEAFRAVIADAEGRGSVDTLWCLGDLVGYGADPIACIELLRGYQHEMVLGNHDLAAVGAIGTDEFNPYAATAARWTHQQLSPEGQVWLLGLSGVRVLDSGFTLTHGSLVDPVWDYLLFADGAVEHLARQSTPWGMVGHTHLPRVFYDGRLDAVPADIEDGAEVRLDATRFVANPGSVGQPRDGDPRAAYGIVDTDEGRIAFHRVEYDIAAAQRKIIDAGLPMVLAERLSRGR